MLTLRLKVTQIKTTETLVESKCAVMKLRLQGIGHERDEPTLEVDIPPESIGLINVGDVFYFQRHESMQVVSNT